jgi:hypothetical protein
MSLFTRANGIASRASSAADPSADYQSKAQTQPNQSRANFKGRSDSASSRFHIAVTDKSRSVPSTSVPTSTPPTPTPTPNRLITWLLTLLVAAFGGLLRFVRLGDPREIVFDETYYVKDAWTALLTGEPRDWPKTTVIDGIKQPIDTAFAAGHVGGWLDTAEYVVHPPVGKWLIALGLKLFGGATNIFAWRVSVAVAGTVAIILMIRVALRLFRNVPIALIAGLLLSLDGVGIVMSRTGLLDNFIMVFALGASVCCSSIATGRARNCTSNMCSTRAPVPPHGFPALRGAASPSYSTRAGRSSHCHGGGWALRFCSAWQPA